MQSNKQIHPLLNQVVLVRANLAGVHIGTLVETGDFVVLEDSYRLWSWSDAFTLSEVSQFGIGNQSRVAKPVKTMTIPIVDVGEIINMEDAAFETVKKNVDGGK